MGNYLHQAYGTANGYPWSVNAVSVSSGTEGAAETAWHTGFYAAWNSAGLLALIPATTSVLGTYTSTANAQFKQTTATRTAATVAGTGGACLPQQCCTLLSFTSANATKWGRARWYFPSLTAASLAATGGLYSAATMTAIQTAFNTAFTTWAATLTFQILHRHATLTGPGADTLTPITGARAASKLAIQRRRGDKSVVAYTTITL
jgi:hypothetical protein